LSQISVVSRKRQARIKAGTDRSAVEMRQRRRESGKVLVILGVIEEWMGEDLRMGAENRRWNSLRTANCGTIAPKVCNLTNHEKS